MRVTWGLLALGMAACGGPAQTTTVEAPAPPPANTPPKPPPSYRLTEIARQEFSLGSGCTNGPFEITINVPEVKWLNRLRVYTVADRELPLRFESFDSLSTYLVDAQPDERCHARAGEAPATSAPQATPAGSGRAESRAPSSATTLPQLTAPAPQLPTHLHGELLMTAGEPGPMPDLDSDRLGNCWYFSRARTGPRKLRIYLPNVQKVDGVVVRVVTEEIESTGSREEFLAKVAERAAHDKEVAASRAEACRANPQDHQCWVGCEHGSEHTGIGISHSPHGAPPARKAETPPPRPRADAEWIAGSWRWTDERERYEWDAGFWRVPMPVAEAPAPPPPPSAPPPPAPRAEAPPPRPAEPTVVWVPGVWIWTGGGWAWAPGVWRAPRGVVFVRRRR